MIKHLSQIFVIFITTLLCAGNVIAGTEPEGASCPNGSSDCSCGLWCQVYPSMDNATECSLCTNAPNNTVPYIGFGAGTNANNCPWYTVINENHEWNSGNNKSIQCDEHKTAPAGYVVYHNGDHTTFKANDSGAPIENQLVTAAKSSLDGKFAGYYFFNTDFEILEPFPTCIDAPYAVTLDANGGKFDDNATITQKTIYRQYNNQTDWFSGTFLYDLGWR